MVFKYLKSWLTGGDVGLEVKLPSLLVVDNLEEAVRLQRISNPKKKLVIHSPEMIAKFPNEAEDYGSYKRIKIGRKAVRQAMTELYKNSSQLQEDTKKALKSLEDRIEDAAEKRDKETEKLSEAAKSLGHDKNAANIDEQVDVLISRLLTTQFEHPEHFIREAIQNADGSWEKKEENRIDVYLDSKNRTVRVEDRGRGMTPGELDKYFFTVFASQNQGLDYAAGKFGIGAVSFFGLGHEYVIVDSKPREGEGGRVVIDENLAKPLEILGTTRTAPGTTIEIELKEKSVVDFQKIIQILKEDCCYIETPLYVHLGPSTKKLNKPLDPKNSATTISFKEEHVEGFLEKAVSGKLDLLDHRIRLSSMPTKGYTGAVNCSELDTTFSRDCAVQDPVLRQVLAIVDEKRKILESSMLKESQLPLEARVKKYHTFVKNNLFDEERMPNERWIMENFSTFISSNNTYEPNIPWTILGGVLGFGAGITPSGLPSMILFGPPVLAGTCAGFGCDWLYKKIFPRKKKHSTAEEIFRAMGALTLGAGIGISAFLGEVYGLKALISQDTIRETVALLTDYTKAGISIFLPLGTALGALKDAHYYTYKGIVNRKYRNLEKIAATAPADAISKYRKSIFNYIPIVSDIYRYFKVHAPSLSSIGNGIAKAVKYAAVTIGLAIGVSAVGYGATIGMSKFVPANLFDNLRVVAPGGHYETREDLARALRRSNGMDGGISIHGCGGVTIEGEPSKSALNSLSKVSKWPLWANEMPIDELVIHAWNDTLVPEEITKNLTPESTLEEKLKVVRGYMMETFEYDAIPNLDIYEDVIDAMLAEKKAVCDSANTYAALLLHELGVKRIHYLVGNNHAWLEVDHGTKDAPDWQAFDMTPERMNPELFSLLKKKPNKPIEVPLEPFLLAALGVAGITFYRRTKAKRRIWKEYNGELSNIMQQKLDEIKEALQRIPEDVTVMYGKNLGKEDSRFYMSRNRIVLNMQKDHNPQMIALGYASLVLKNEGLAKSIAEKYKEGK